MKKKGLFITKILHPVWVLSFLGVATLVALTSVYIFNIPIFGNYVRTPSPERIFWRTMDQNLRSQTVELKSRIHFSLANQEIEVLRSDLKLIFDPVRQSAFKQQNLIFDRDIHAAYPNKEQVDNYRKLGVKILPKQDWYQQEALDIDQQLYMRHFFFTKPKRDDWQALVEDPLEALPQSGQWYHIPATDEGLYIFSATLPTGDGLFYANLDSSDRKAFLRQLRQAYNVRWQDVDAFDIEGRLHYQYSLRFNHQHFNTALIDYYNLQTTDPDLKIDSQTNLLRRQEVVYNLVVDAVRHRVVSVEHEAIVPLADYRHYLALVHQYSPLIHDLKSRFKLSLKVRTTLVSQNRPLVLQPPQAMPIPVREKEA